MSEAPETAPVAADFTFTQKIDAAAATALATTDFAWAAADKKATFKFAEIAAADAEQSVVISVSYKGAAAVAANAFKVAPKPDELAVESVSAINAKTFEVTFNKALTDAEKAAAEFTFARQGSTGTYGMDTANKVWAADNKSVNIARVGGLSLDPGVYTVTVTGITGLEAPNNTATSAAVVAQTVTSIEITADTLAKAAGATPATATVRYIVKDQYGEDMTTDAGTNLTTTASYGATAIATAGTVTITHPNNDWNSVGTPATVTLTIVHGVTGKSVSKTLNVGEAVYVKELTITGTGFYNTTPATTRFQTGRANAGYLTLTAKDQYGNPLTTYAQLQPLLTFASSSDRVTATITDNLGGTTSNLPAVINIDTTTNGGVAQATDVLITAIGAAGATAQYTIRVELAPVATTPELGAPENLIASGDHEGVVVFPLKVKNQFGAELTTDQIVAAAGSINISSTVAGLPQGNLAIATSGSNRGKIVYNGGTVGAAGTGQVTVTIGANTSSQNVTINPAAYAKTFKLADTVPTDMVNGSTFQTRIIYIDQYGRDMQRQGVAATAALPVAVATDIANTNVVTTLAQNTTILTATVPASGGGTTNLNTAPSQNHDNILRDGVLSTANAITLTAAATGTGTATLSIAMTRTTTDPGTFTITQQINIKANTGTGTYTIDPIPTLRIIAGYNTDVAGSGTVSPYAKPVIVKLDGAVVPSSNIINVTVEGPQADNFTVSNGLQTGVSNIASYNNQWLVGGATGGTGTTPERTGTLTVVVQTTAGPKVLTQEIKASTAALTVEDLKAYTAAVTDPITPATTASPFAGMITFATAAAANTGSTAGGVNVYVVDQYGVHHPVTATSGGTKSGNLQFAGVADDAIGVGTYGVRVISNNENLLTFGHTAANTGVTVVDNCLKATTGTFYRANTPLAATLLAGTKSLQVSFQISAVADIGAPTVSAKTVAGSDGTITITFDRGLSAEARTAVEQGLTAAATGTDIDLSYAWAVQNDGTDVLTITNAGAASPANDATFTDDVTIQAANVVDAVGNVNTTAVVIDVN